MPASNASRFEPLTVIGVVLQPEHVDLLCPVGKEDLAGAGHLHQRLGPHRSATFLSSLPTPPIPHAQLTSPWYATIEPALAWIVTSASSTFRSFTF